MSDSGRSGRSFVASLLIAFLLAGTPPAALTQQIPESARTTAAQPDVRRIAADSMRTATTFQVALGVAPEAIARAFLVYELAGVPQWTAAVRSINGLPALGGFGAVASSGTAVQIEEINPRWLRAGTNEIRFSPAAEGDSGAPSHVTDLRRHDLAPAVPDLAVPYTVRNLRLVYLEGAGAPLPALRLAYPVGGESSDDGTVVRGWVDPPLLAGGAAELFVDGAYIPEGIDRVDGSFAVYAPRTGAAGEPWDVDVEVVYPDGTRLRQSAHVGGDPHKDDGDDDGDGTHLDADAATEKSMSIGDAHLDLTRDALAGKVKLTMRRLRHDELPALEAGMTNVTPERRGFRFGPHGLKFRKAVRLRIPYDPALLPKGMTAGDVRTFFFDESSGRWVPIARIEAQAKLIVSATDHFTDFINATLAVPDHPEGTNLSPNSLQELAKADPAAEIVQIAPPEGGPAGDANLEFPIVVPPGRHGMQPDLHVQYSSSGGNRWLGVGWDLRTSSIEIKTSFGVPRYDGNEKYLLDGDELADADGGTYVRRIEGKFDRIVRHGSGPGGYWWEVTDKNGVTSTYGQSAQACLRDPHDAASGNIFRWYLERETDLYGNRVDYSYFSDRGSNGEPWIQLYPQQIDYTAGPNNTPAFYRVTFTLDAAGTRSDRLSSGRQGFKTYTQHRLDSIDVTAGGALVRRYLFRYAAGELSKSLLSSIAVTGEDGATALYRHDFEYTKMPRRDDGTVDGFTEQQSWGGIAAGSNFTSSAQIGGGAHGFVGLGPVDCQPHGGAQLGGGGSATTDSVAFADVDGDGLPDRIDSSGHVDLNLYKPANDASGTTPGSFGPWQMTGAQTLGHTTEWNIDFGAGAHLETGVTAIAGATWAWSHSNEDRLVLDMNGDGRPDLVSTDGGFSVALNDGSKFGAVPWSGFDAAGLRHLASPKEEADTAASFTLANTLLQLALPYDGRVTVSGALQKKEAGGDGLDAAIYRNGALLWSHHLAAGETTPCTPGPANGCGGGLAATVSAGDSLYFLTSAGRDTSKDAVLWSPAVAYDGQDAAAREPYGASVYVFDARRDFSFYGYTGPGWSAIASGNVAVSGTLVKAETSNDVTVSIVRRRPGSIPLEETILTRALGAAEQASVAIGATTSVQRGDVLFFRVSSALPVDAAAIQWTPTVSYVGATDPTGLPANALTQPAQVAAAPPKLAASSPLTQWWTPGITGDMTLSFDCTTSTAATLYIQGVDRLLAKQDVASGHSSPSVKFTATAGAQNFVTLLGQSTTSPGNCKVNGGKVPLNVVWPAAAAASNVLSGGYHGWYYGEWNGNVPFDPAALVQPRSKDDPPPPWVAALPRWNGTTAFASPAWIASGFDLYLAAEGVKPSRKGMNVAAALDQASGVAAGGALSALRMTATDTVGAAASLGAGVAGAGLTYSHGETDTQLDLIDMNGDGYPDQVSADGVRFSTGSSFGPLQPFANLGSSVRHSKDDNAGVSAGFGVNFTKKNGKGQPTAVLNVMPSAGNDVSVTQTTDDLIDVNGDGLPDRVHMDPGGSQATVRLNLGYGFGAPETWDLPPLRAAGHCADTVSYVSDGIDALSPLDTMNGLSFTVSSEVSAEVAVGPFGGGASTSLSRTLVELVDIDGDGLPDRVAKDSKDEFFRVQLNLGDRWGDEQLWYAPAWRSGSRPGDGYNVLSPTPFQFTCLDAISLTGNIQGQGSAGVPLCIPLIVVGIQVEISGQAYRSDGNGMQLLLEDIDGDGVPDHVLKIANDPTVYVKRNKAAKVNLLSAVHRPLGSTIDLSYERRGNTTSDPSNHWVLSGVSVTDPRSTTYVTKYHYDNDAVYDRAERESYGFHHLTVTLPDGSTVDRLYDNSTFYSRHFLTAETYASGGTAVKSYVAEHAEDTIAAGTVTVSNARFPRLASETTTLYEAGGSKAEKKDYAYDAEGNVVTIADRGENLGDAGDDVVTNIAYRIDADHHFTHPSRVDVLDRSTIATYDGQGALRKIEKILSRGNSPDSGTPYSGTQNPVWTYEYDPALGNMSSAVDPDGRELRFTYDGSAYAYPISVEDRTFGFTTTYEYDFKYGAPKKTVDENGNAVQIVRDTFGRISSVIGPDDTDSSPTLRFRYDALPAGAAAVVEHKDVTRPGAHIDSATFIDSLERVLQTKEDAELDGGSGTSAQTGSRASGPVQFDARSRVISEGQPLFDASRAPSFLENAPAINTTRFTYDALDRVTAVTFPFRRSTGANAATTLAYSIASFDGTPRFLTTRTDPEGRVTRFYRDLHDNVIAVEQNGLVTRYTYDLLDELTSVKDPKGNVTSLAYDTLGRAVTLDNPDLGKIESRYDPAGNLGAKITPNLRARGQQIRYRYTHGRLDRIDYPQSPAVVYTWGDSGAPANGKNRILAVADASGVEQRSYDKLGNVIQSVKTAAALNGNTPKGPFTTRYNYDPLGRLLSVTYPDGETLTYGFDTGGQVKSATGTLKGAAYPYLRHAGYDRFGQRVRLVLGNGAEMRHAYDPASRFLAALRTTVNGTDVESFTYAYDATGTMTSLQNNQKVPAAGSYGGAVTQTFAYDAFVQLTHATGSYTSAPNAVSKYTLDLTYDTLGNLTSKNQMHQTGPGGKQTEKKTTYNAAYTYAAAGPQPHAATRIGDRTFHYDANGNQTGWETDGNGTRRTLAWDEENRLSSVSDNGKTTSFLYDADGTRTNKAGQNGETIYLNPWFSLRNGAIASKHVFIDGERLATKVSPDPAPPSEKVYYYHPDHLGSANFVTDEAGTSFEHLEYFPSGEIWVDEHSDTQRTPYLFSGKELDDETGLSYFGARYYDARQGQWISADPILDEMLEEPDGEELSPAPFHRSGSMTAYVADDPLNRIDADGRVGEQLVTVFWRSFSTSVTKGKIGVGGAYRFTKKFSLQGVVESNHVPSKSQYAGTPYEGIAVNDMTSVTMEHAAHKAALSTGNSYQAQAHHAREHALLKKGNFAQAVKINIVDMITKTSSQNRDATKGGIIQMIQYAMTQKIPGRRAALIQPAKGKKLIEFTKKQP